MKFAEYTAGTGVDALCSAIPAPVRSRPPPPKIREVTALNGPDIYRATSVTRQVYILIGSFPQAGSSGSAVIDLHGQVIDVYFVAESHDSTTGFAMTAAQVAPQMAKAGGTQAVGTGTCVIG